VKVIQLSLISAKTNESKQYTGWANRNCTIEQSCFILFPFDSDIEILYISLLCRTMTRCRSDKALESIPTGTKLRNNLGQVVHTYVTCASVSKQYTLVLVGWKGDRRPGGK